jgi:O-antigen/teichoic acid export membrane protein
MVKMHNAIRALGITVCLIGAYLMAWGDPLLGESHSGIATVVGILGLGIITSGNSVAVAKHGEGK